MIERQIERPCPIPGLVLKIIEQTVTPSEFDTAVATLSPPDALHMRMNRQCTRAAHDTLHGFGPFATKLMITC
jgi:hypothetical protein